MAALSKKFITECKKQLLLLKAEGLNRVNSAKAQLGYADSRGGDIADQTVKVLAEEEFLRMSTRLRLRLQEIEYALARIDSGAYGLCEETEEAIEKERLLAIPWARLSLEGAELRESMNRQRIPVNH
ncbi:MAG: TraR/DksA family transcriptional regulator [Bdellovibrionaceae bacterium]|nr:TraR/DksA family transcriptional regulator [Pseudobdellovibrionaceae bacterium]